MCWKSDVPDSVAESICRAYERRWENGQHRGDLEHEFVDKTVKGGSYIIVDPIKRKVKHITKEEWNAHSNKYYQGIKVDSNDKNDYSIDTECSYSDDNERDEYGLTKKGRFGMSTEEYIRWNGGPPESSWTDDNDN